MNVRVLAVYMKECRINGIEPSIEGLISLNKLLKEH